MILNKKTKEGYLLIDHRGSPGVPGLPKFLELASYTCSHCQRQVIRNPSRERPRAWCPKCDKYVCDQCEAVRHLTGCVPFDAKIEKQLNQLATGVAYDGKMVLQQR